MTEDIKKFKDPIPLPSTPQNPIYEEPEPMRELTLRQELFCHQYLIDRNGTQAAIRTGYSAKTARQQASRLLRNVNIKIRINELIKEVIERLNENIRKEEIRKLNEDIDRSLKV